MWVTDTARILRCCDSGVGLAATAPIRLLAWEPPYAAGAALEKAQRQKKKKKKKERKKLITAKCLCFVPLAADFMETFVQMACVQHAVKTSSRTE